VKQVEEGHRLGAAGLKEYKRLGLYLRDGEGKLIRIDDPKLDPVWKRCGELKMPVSIHVADPRAFWAALRFLQRALDGIEGSSRVVVRRHKHLSAREWNCWMR
jgi:hypothetical protein